MLTVEFEGRVWSADDVPLGIIDRVERDSGRRWHELPATTSGLALIADAMIGTRDVRLDAFGFAEDDRPTMFRNGMPTEGGRTADQFIIMFGKQPWCWPPDVVLRQSLRNLLVLADSLEGD